MRLWAARGDDCQGRSRSLCEDRLLQGGMGGGRGEQAVSPYVEHEALRITSATHRLHFPTLVNCCIGMLCKPSSARIALLFTNVLCPLYVLIYSSYIFNNTGIISMWMFYLVGRQEEWSASVQCSQWRNLHNYSNGGAQKRNKEMKKKHICRAKRKG